MSKCCEEMDDWLEELDDEEFMSDGGGKGWIRMEADGETIKAIGRAAEQRGLSIAEFFVYCCVKYENGIN